MVAAVPSDYVYLDHAATAPLSAAAAAAMEPYLVAGSAGIAQAANPNSLHGPGRAAFAAMERARSALARALGAGRPDEIVFTGSATEADDAAVLGIAWQAALERDRERRQRRNDAGTAPRRDEDAAPVAGLSFAPHVITSAIEHDAVLAPCKRLEREGFRVTYLMPDADGFVTVRALEAAIDEDTVLVSVQMANSEIGTIQPIEQLAAVAHDHGALFHSDCVQALGKVPLHLGELGVDAASFSAHKIGGPKGVGALYLKARTPFRPLVLGGGQEQGRRSGTQNLCGIVGFAAAAAEVCEGVEDAQAQMMVQRDRLYERLCAMAPVQSTVDVPPGSRDHLPNIVAVLVDGFESETLILRLDALGYGVAGGSACSSHSLAPSHVQRALGKNDDEAHSALRISFGRSLDRATADGFLAAFAKVIAH